MTLPVVPPGDAPLQAASSPPHPVLTGAGTRRQWLGWALASAAGPAVSGEGAGASAPMRAERPRPAPADWKTQVELLAAQAPNTHAVLVEQQGRRLAEVYFTGEDRPRSALFSTETTFDAHTLHDMRSVSKSVVALLVGIARGRGLLGSDDKPVLDWFPEHADLATPALRALRLEHLLSMTAGLAWDETSSSYASLGNSEMRLHLSLDPVRHVLTREPVAAPGTRFIYNGGCTLLLGAILERATGSPLLPWARMVLFDPLGLTADEVEWMSHPLWGTAVPYAGLRLTPRGMLRLGRLLLLQGRTNSQGPQQVVPADWVAMLQQPRIAALDGMQYGYQWWLGQVQRGPAQGTPWVAARGNGGQLLMLLPTLEAQIAITAGRYNQPLNGRPSMLLARGLIESLRASGA